MNNAVRRALNTPPSPTKSLIGKSERAQKVERLELVDPSQKTMQFPKFSFAALPQNEVVYTR
jgi:hypothetical protein